MSNINNEVRNCYDYSMKCVNNNKKENNEKAHFIVKSKHPLLHLEHKNM